MFDYVEFFSASVAGIPLLFVVMGLVTYYGKLGLSGKTQLVASMLTGLVLGVGYMVSDSGVPVDFAGWFVIVVYGLALGLATSGVYDTLKEAVG